MAAGTPAASATAWALAGCRLTRATNFAPGTSRSARAWKLAMIPQPTMTTPGMTRPSSGSGRLEQRRGLPQVLQPAQRRGRENGVNQQVAHEHQEVACALRPARPERLQRDEDGEQGCAL